MVIDSKKTTTAVVVSDIDAACMARALGLKDDVLPQEGHEELIRQANKYFKMGRLHEIDKVQGETLALTEALNEYDESMTNRGMKLRQLLRDVGGRLRLATEQAKK